LSYYDTYIRLTVSTNGHATDWQTDRQTDTSFSSISYSSRYS